MQHVCPFRFAPSSRAPLFFLYLTGIIEQVVKFRKDDTMFSIGMPEVMMILVIALVVFGPGKLPEIGKAIGKGINEFRSATSLELKDDAKPEPAKLQDSQGAASQATSPAVNNGQVTAKAEEKK